MPINPSAGATSNPVVVRWTSTDCLVYALGVGCGAEDPCDPSELPFTTENSIGIAQRALPTLPLGLALGESPLRSVGDFDWNMLVNAEQRLTLHGPLPVDGAVRGQNRIVGIYDKGSGALVEIEGDARDAATGEPQWTTRTGIFIRGEGGWGGDRGPSGARLEVPDRQPDEVVTYVTHPDQALLFRLSGDRTPLHSDPAVARRAGFARPILHGRCTLAFAGRAVLRTVCDGEPTRFRSIRARFAKPVLPGDALTTSIWIVGSGEAAFQTATGHGTVVLASGRCTFDA